MKRRRSLTRLSLFVVSLALIVAACAPKVDPEEKCNFVQNSQMQRVSWKGNYPIQLAIDESIPEDYRDAIHMAAAQWNYAANLPLFVILEDMPTPILPEKDGVNAIYFLNTWEDDKLREQARTTIFWKGDKIYEADIRINAQNFEFSGQETVEFGKVDMESLMVHELGHVLGLQHIDHQESVMATHLAAGYERRNPELEDAESLRCEYI